jgi:ABC-type amino acid transport substrate-binding protein
VFGTYEDGHLEFVNVTAKDRFTWLNDDKFDVLIRLTTHTMERQVKEKSTGQGFAFSVPYLHNSLRFGGIPKYVECIDNNDTMRDDDICADLRVCVLEGSTHEDIVKEKFHNFNLTTALTSESHLENFMNEKCNVIAGEEFDIAEHLLRDKGFSGEYDTTKKSFSKEPLCMVTRSDDVEWSDLVNWCLQALLTAEDQGISQRFANRTEPTDVFGKGSEFEFAFRNIVRAVGNYGQIYTETLENILTRPAVDKINKGNTGLIYSFPFGNLNYATNDTDSGLLLAEIKSSGKLKCGVMNRPGIAYLDTATGSWSGTCSRKMSHGTGQWLTHCFGTTQGLLWNIAKPYRPLYSIVRIKWNTWT